MSDISIGMERLNVDNYPSWCFRMKSYLVVEGLWELIEREPPIVKTAEWMKKDEIARAKIGLFVDDSQIPYIIDAKTAKEAWIALRIQHEKFNSKLLTFRKMCQLKFTEDGNVEEHIASFAKYICQLSILGLTLPDIAVVGMLMATLPHSSLDLIMEIEKKMKEEGGLPFKKVSDMVLEWYKGSKVITSKQYHNHLNSSLNGDSVLEDIIRQQNKCLVSPLSPRHRRNRS